MLYTSERNSFKERGALAVTALIIVLALLVLGSLTSLVVVTERNISRNHKMATDAFYRADGGHPLAVRVIENITEGTEEPCQNFSIAGNLKNEVMGYHRDNSSLNDKHHDSPENAPDIRGTVGGETLHIDIDRIATGLMYGSSAEFASGGEGTGLGGGASKKLLFEITSQSRLQGGVRARVITVYRRVL